jgi:plastocyanin
VRRIPLPLTSFLVAASIVGARPSPSMAPVPVTTSVAASAPVTHVAVVDWGFRPSTVTLGRGGTVVFDFEGPSHHTATDSSGLGLYDSGSVGPGGPSISFTFEAAGIYPFTCTPHPLMGGRVSVPVRVTPRSAGVGERLTVTWATVDASGSRVYDVQLRRPRSTWEPWRMGVSELEGAFSPHAGTGRYRFRARLRDPAIGEASRWSVAATVRVRR